MRGPKVLIFDTNWSVVVGVLNLRIGISCYSLRDVYVDYYHIIDHCCLYEAVVRISAMN